MNEPRRGAEDEAARLAAAPCLGVLLEMMVRLVPLDPAAAFAILDLGAGSGILAAALLAHFPNARATLVEESEMLCAAARQRLAADLGRIEIMPAAFAHTELPRGFAVVVSLLQLHALDDIARRATYRGVYRALEPDGAFLVADRVRPPTAGVAALYARIADGNTAAAAKGMFLTKELPWLASVGFRDVDVHYKNLDYALFGARRPTASDFALGEAGEGKRR